MSGPNQTLTALYENEDQLNKEAGILEFMARLGMGSNVYARDRLRQERSNRQVEEAQLLNAQFRAEEQARIEQATRRAHLRMILSEYSPEQSWRGSMAQMYGDQVPLGMDEGMVRMASIMSEAGADLAKQAGIGDALMQGLKGMKGMMGAAGSTAAQAGQGMFSRAMTGLKSGFGQGIKTPSLFAGKVQRAAHAAGVEMAPKQPGMLSGLFTGKNTASLNNAAKIEGVNKLKPMTADDTFLKSVQSNNAKAFPAVSQKLTANPSGGMPIAAKTTPPVQGAQPTPQPPVQGAPNQTVTANTQNPGTAAPGTEDKGFLHNLIVGKNNPNGTILGSVGKAVGLAGLGMAAMKGMNTVADKMKQEAPNAVYGGGMGAPMMNMMPG